MSVRSLSESGSRCHPAALQGEPMATREQWLTLLPIAAAVLARDDAHTALVASNHAFSIAGLLGGDGTLPAALLDEVRGFLDSAREQRQFAWQSGGAVDARHFTITLARLSPVAGRCLMTLVERTTELRTERSLRREMSSDALTGLPNRAGFTDAVEALEAAGLVPAVLIVDLRRFSRVNECLGELAGDELIISVARRMRGALRAGDTLARLGGNEFGVLLAVDHGPDEADHVAARLRQALAHPFRLTEYEIHVDCAIGLAVSGDDVRADELIRHAQFAAKRAKSSARTEIYQPRALADARASYEVETALRRAIERDELRLLFQPICDLASDRVVAFETLVRWTDANGCERLPDQFIPIAEETGLILPLGRWVIAQATRTLAAWDRAAGGHSGVRLAVNLSATQLQRDAIVPVLQRALDAAGLSAERLELELTESVLVSDPERIAATMRALKALGSTLVMDDFGTGYSHLASLQKLPIDTLKIDRSFVSGMLADRDKLAIVRGVLSLAQALGKATVAEGVETNEVAQTLAALGCTYGQGYLYARPLEADAAYALLAARSN